MNGGTTPQRKRRHILDNNIGMGLRELHCVDVEWTDLNKSEIIQTVIYY
jgi:hypothetical protein